MKDKVLIFLLAILSSLYACSVRVRHPHVAIFHSVEALMRGDSTRTGFFTNTSFFDAKYQEVEYRTSRGNVFVKNDGTQNFLACRYDPATLQPIWIAVGGGAGGDGGCNYYTVPPENAVYVVGYFEGTAYFPIKAESNRCDTVTSRGGADMFIAKYRYDTGALEWIASGGSAYSDIVFTDNLGARHTETLITVDSAAVTVYTNFFGPATFGNLSIDAKLTGSAVQVRYDKATGETTDVQFVTTLPQLINTKK